MIGVQFLVFEKAKRSYRKLLGPVPQASVLAGSTAGIAAVCCTYPFDLLRARMAFAVGHDALSVRSTVQKIMNNEGTAAFYRGITPTLIGMLPYAGISFGVYDYIKHRMLEFRLFQTNSNSDRLNPVANVICGGFAGTIAQTISYPLDVVRRRMQVDPHRPSQSGRYVGIVQTLRCVYAEGGMRAIFRGVTLNYVREFPQVGIAFAVYENLKVLFGVYKDQ